MQKVVILLASLIAMLVSVCEQVAYANEQQPDSTAPAADRQSDNFATRELIHYAAVQYTLAVMSQGKTDTIGADKEKLENEFGKLEPSEIDTTKFCNELVGPALKEKGGWGGTREKVTRPILKLDKITVEDLCNCTTIFSRINAENFLGKHSTYLKEAQDKVKNKAEGTIDKQETAPKQTPSSVDTAQSALANKQDTQNSCDDAPKWTLSDLLPCLLSFLFGILFTLAVVLLIARKWRIVGKMGVGKLVKKVFIGTASAETEAANSGEKETNANEISRGNKPSPTLATLSTEHEKTKEATIAEDQNVATVEPKQEVVENIEPQEKEELPSAVYYARPAIGGKMLIVPEKKGMFRITKEGGDWCFKFCGNEPVAISHWIDTFENNSDVRRLGHSHVVTLSPGTVEQESEDTWLVTKKAKIEIR